MAWVKMNSGHVYEWDDSIAVGSLITAYHQGYHVLERIEFVDPKPRNPNLLGSIFDNFVVEYSDDLMREIPIFHYCQVLRANGLPGKALRRSCSAMYCQLVTSEVALKQRNDEIEAANTKFNNIFKYL